MKYPKTSILILVSTLLMIGILCRVRVIEGRNYHHVPPLLPPRSPVIELSNGSLTEAQSHLQKSTFVFLMFYSHWCATSRKAIQQFHRASEPFKGQVTFIAINCWIGSCRQTNHFSSFPHFFFHHSVYETIEYRGQYSAQNLIKFIHNAVYPITYISNALVLQHFLHQRKPSLVAYCNGTNHLDLRYNEFFGAALQLINQVSSLQFGVITCLQVASTLGLNTFGQVVLVNPNEVKYMYPSNLKFNSSNLLQWTKQNKLEYVEELDPDITEVSELRQKMRSKPFVTLFVAKNSKIVNRNTLKLYHQVAVDYNNCSCNFTKASKIQTTSFQDTSSVNEESALPHKMGCGELLRKPHITSCQSLPLSFGFRYGVQNVCDVCQECYRICSCDVTTVPKGISTSSLLRNLFPLHSGCRSLRKTYHENNYDNFFSVCCFPKTMPKFRDLLLSPYLNSLDEQLQTDLIGSGDFKVLADNLENFQGSIRDVVSRNDAGLVKNLLHKLLKMFSSDVSGNRKKQGLDFVEEIEQSSEPTYREYGSCDQRGKVHTFAGAGCYSNKTVAFYYMDSRKYWKYAKVLGVRGDYGQRNALVIVDVEKEAQYVLPEETELSNSTIVNFIMQFTLGNLTRRLRSAPVPRQQCLNGSCVVEVVTLTFSEIVLNPNKDVLLMYYTPWCGFCKSVKPSYVALAHHFRLSEDVIIARINTDLNELPWEYTVDSYPTFVFFPAKRKDMSVVYPDEEEPSLENFILFVARQRNTRLFPVTTDSSCSGEKILRLQKEKSLLTRTNFLLRWRLKRQVEERRKADKKRLIMERQLNALLSTNFDEERLRLSLEEKVRELRIVNSNLLDELLTTRQKLRDQQENAAKIARELRVKLAELDGEGSLKYPIEPPDENQ